MDKSMEGLHLVKNDNDLIDTKDLAVETTKGDETRLDLNAVDINITTTTRTTDEELGPNYTTAIPIPSCNSADIIPRLINVYKKQMMCGAVIVLIIAVVSIILSGICFFIVIKLGISKSTVRLLGAGISGIIFGVSLLPLSYTLYYSSHNGLDWMNHVVQIIQLNGQTWRSQLDSNRNRALNLITGIYRGNNEYDRLKMRPQGYIVLAEDGIIIDELFAIQYETFIPLRIDLIDNTTHTENVLRLFLATRHQSKDGSDNGKQIEFELNIFMAAHMQAQELADIRQSILSKWNRRLTLSGFNKNSVANQHLRV